MTNCLGLIAYLVVGLAMKTSAAPPDAPQLLSTGNAELRSASFRHIPTEEGNQVISPLGMEILLSTAILGAQGKTATQLEQALALFENKFAVTRTFKIDATLAFADKNFTIKQDNLVFKPSHGIFTDDGVKFDPFFVPLAESLLKAQVIKVNYGTPEKAAQTINDFVNKNTGDKNKDLIDSDDLDNLSKAFLLNSVYFKTNWAEEFTDSKTYKGKFHLDKHFSKEVDFIQIPGYFNITVNDELGARIAEIPYKGGNVSMLLLLPQETDLADLESKLANYDLTQLTKQGFNSPAFVTMPRMKLETTTDLTGWFKKSGVVDLFDRSKANLTRIAESPLFVSKVIQKTYFELTDEGPKRRIAHASFVPEYYPSYMRAVVANRPFLFLLKHIPTGSCLSIGRVISP